MLSEFLAHSEKSEFLAHSEKEEISNLPEVGPLVRLQGSICNELFQDFIYSEMKPVCLGPIYLQWQHTEQGKKQNEMTFWKNKTNRDY
jgi:hypothetical protein